MRGDQKLKRTERSPPCAGIRGEYPITHSQRRYRWRGELPGASVEQRIAHQPRPAARQAAIAGQIAIAAHSDSEHMSLRAASPRVVHQCQPSLLQTGGKPCIEARPKEV